MGISKRYCQGLRQWGQSVANAIMPWLCLHCHQHPAPVLCVACRANATLSITHETLPLDGQKVGDMVYGWRYEGAIRSVIRAIKYGGNQAALGWLCQAAGPLLSEAMGRYHADLMIPIPASRDRWLQRGFNLPLACLEQHQEARAISAPVLVRVTPTVALAGLGVETRQMVMKTCMAVVGNAVRNRRVVLLDDILTTGTTMSIAAQACHAAGASWVGMVGLSRALKHVTQHTNTPTLR